MLWFALKRWKVERTLIFCLVFIKTTWTLNSGMTTISLAYQNKRLALVLVKFGFMKAMTNLR